MRLLYSIEWRWELLEDDLEYIEQNFEGATLGVARDAKTRRYLFEDYKKHDIHSFNDKAFQDFLDRKFDNTYGSVEGLPFHIYTKDYIFASLDYDGKESYIYLPRNPHTFLDKNIFFLSDTRRTLQYEEIEAIYRKSILKNKI